LIHKDRHLYYVVLIGIFTDYSLLIDSCWLCCWGSSSLWVTQSYSTFKWSVAKDSWWLLRTFCHIRLSN